MPRPMTSAVSSWTTPSVETWLASVGPAAADCSADCPVESAAGFGLLGRGVAGAPYEGDVAITVSCFETVGLVPRRAALALGDRADEEAVPLPATLPPLLVGIVSTYWETAEAGPSSAAAEYGRPRTATAQTRQPTPK